VNHRIVERFNRTDDASDFGTTFVFEYEDGACVVNFEAHEITGFRESSTTKGVYDVPIYDRYGYKGDGDETENLDEACPQVHGRVKWDGCSHVYFGNAEAKGESPDGYLHLCGKSHWEWLQAVLARAWMRCREILIGTGHWNKDCAEK